VCYLFVSIKSFKTYPGVSFSLILVFDFASIVL
jgi:hypothetical protein